MAAEEAVAVSNYVVPIIGNVGVATMFGLVIRNIYQRFKKVEEAVDKKQPKELCASEHTHLTDTLIRIENCVTHTSHKQEEILIGITANKEAVLEKINESNLQIAVINTQLGINYNDKN